MERTVRRALTVLAVSVGVSLGSAAMATAQPPGPPQSGDSRATAVAGNVTNCAGAGIPGVEISVTSNITENTYIDITGVQSGYEITGVVVKGSAAYNKYPNLGPLPWNDLHPPLAGNSGKPAEISHWFVCGQKKTTTTTTTSKTTETTTKTTTTTSSGSSGSTTTKPGSSTSSSSDSNVVTTTKSSTPAGVVPAANSAGLAETGFSLGLPLTIGVLLLIGGGAVLLLTRARRRS